MKIRALKILFVNEHSYLYDLYMLARVHKPQTLLSTEFPPLKNMTFKNTPSICSMDLGK